MLPRQQAKTAAAAKATPKTKTKHAHEHAPDEPVAHEFEPQRFKNLTKCFVCDDMIENDIVTGILGYTPEMLKGQLPNGVLDQFVPRGAGCTCRVCGVNVHESCRADIKSSCAQVSHRFELRSYPPFSKMCFACGTSLQGLFNQGYQCTECGIACHPGCRTNVNVKVCEANPASVAAAAAAAAKRKSGARGRAASASSDDDEDDADAAHWGMLYEYVRTDSHDSDAALAANHPRTASDADPDAAGRGNWRRSLSKKFTAAMRSAAAAATGSASPSAASASAAAAAAHPSPGSARGPKPIQIPASLQAMGRELRKLHTQARAVSMNEAEQWEREEAPRLKALRADLSDHKKRLKALRAAQAKKVDRRARSRTLHYQAFARKLLARHAAPPLKKPELEARVDALLERYSRPRCRELEMLDALAAALPAAAAAEIDRERREGPCGPRGKLETSLRELDRVHTQVQVATQSLEAVRRELMFPRWRHWFLRVGLEGTYVALGTLWLEQFEGSLASRFTMLPRGGKRGKAGKAGRAAAGENGDDSDDDDRRGGGAGAGTGTGNEDEELVPTMVLALGGYNTSYSFAEMGESAGAAKQRQKESESGMKLVARVERLSVAGNNVPLSFTVDQLSLDLEFFLNIEMEYVRSRKLNFKGEWRLKPNSFSLKFKQFGLSFKSGSLSLPDALLRTLVKNLLTSAAKQAVRAALPPEFGEYMHYVHARTPQHLRCGGNPRDQFQYHGRMSVAAELDLETMDHVLESSAAHLPGGGGKAKAKGGGGGFMSGVARMMGGGGRGARKYTPREEPVLQRVERALGLDPRQMDLFVRTQQELGLTRDNLFPDDSVRELGMKAIYSNVQDLQTTVEAANRLGMKVLAGGALSSEAPLRTVLDIVEYFVTYFGPDARQSALTPRILALWQGALDKVQRELADSGSFRARASQRQPPLRQTSQRPELPAQHSATGGVVRRIVMADLIAQVLRLARKRVITRIELVHGHLAVGVGRLQQALRDRMLQAAEKSRGGNTMVFQMRNTDRARGAADGAGGADDGDDDDDGDDNFDALFGGSGDSSALPRARTGRGRGSKSRTPGGEDDSDDDGAGTLAMGGSSVFLDDATLDGVLGEPALSASASAALRAPVGQKQRAKEEEIERRYAKQRAALDFIRASLLRETTFTLDASAGDGGFSWQVSDGDLVSPVNFTQMLSAGAFSNLSRVNDWPWRRMVRAEGTDLVHMALIRLLSRGTGPGSEVYSSPEDDDALHLVCSGVQSSVQSAGPPLSRVMDISLAPAGVTRDWAKPGQVELSWRGDPELRFCAQMRMLRAYGSVDTLHSYASDILDWVLRSVQDRRTERLSRQLLRALIRYGSLNTFAGSVWTNVQAACTDDDLFVSVSNPQSATASGVDLQLEHDLTDFTDDVAQIIDTYMTDPVNLGAPAAAKLAAQD